jgi:hypothetical protein
MEIRIGIRIDNKRMPIHNTVRYMNIFEKNLVGIISVQKLLFNLLHCYWIKTTESKIKADPEH